MCAQIAECGAGMRKKRLAMGYRATVVLASL